MSLVKEARNHWNLTSLQDLPTSVRDGFLVLAKRSVRSFGCVSC